MYSLPITTYSDYWRRSKQWSSYLGGLVVLVAGTRFSTIEVPIIPHTTQLHPLQTTQSLIINELNTEGLEDQRPENESMIGEETNDEDQTSQELVSQGEAFQEVTRDKTTVRVQVQEKEIPFKTQYVESEKLNPGVSETQEKGEAGVLRQVVKIFEVGGQPMDQKVVSNYELKSPKNEVIIQNSKPIPKKKVIVQTSEPGRANVANEPVNLSDLKISKTLNVEATAYTYTGNNTATGIKPREGLIAVDPNVIAMGSKVYVEGYGYAIAADTGGSILGNRIDVFFGTLRQCIDWGRKPVRIHVLNPT